MEEHFIINGLKARNKTVFDFVFHYYYSGLCAYVEKITGVEEVAEDIVQDLFVTLWIKHDSIEITKSLKDYLFTSVKNRAYDFLKHECRKKGKSDELLRTCAECENLSLNWFVESELEEIINSSLNKLPPRCREIIQLSRFDGLKNHEIAEKFGISKRTVELQISNALKHLRLDLKPYLPITLLMLIIK